MKTLNRLLVNFAYYLNSSDSYQKQRRFFYNLLENDDYRYKKYFDIFMMLLIFSSVSILIYEVKQDVHNFLNIFNAYIISFIFFIEYILRLWVHSSISQVIIRQDEYSDLLDRDFDLLYVVRQVFKDKLEYVLSIKAIIDLLAIMPFFHELRLLRVFVLFRVFKIFRYAKSFSTFASVLATKRFEFITLAMFAAIVIFVASVLIYVMEANNPESRINTLYEAFYWSIVTISTVGYGDVVAVSPEGQFVAVIVILSGISVLAFTTSLFVSAFTEKLEDIKEAKIIQDVSKEKDTYIICGYENIAKEVAKKLVNSKFSVVVLDESAEKIEEAKRNGLQALNYNPGNVDSYKKLNINLSTQVKAVLCLKEDDVYNVYTALTVRSIDKNVKIMSLLMNSSNKSKLVFSGVDEILDDKEFVGLVAREYVGQPVAFEVIHALRAEESNIKIEEITITQRIVENISQVSELDNIEFRVVLLGVYKKDTKHFYFNPIDSTLLEAGDVLFVIGNYIFIREFTKHLMAKSSKKDFDGK
ncbi:ion transporter [Sulfurimonas sp. C5]|uniref:ion transporter n=1 Tax=Sulfurimonas sp. C5 TaxID=3036947 RepID=UPI002458229C|nr:ion transporter [Sulfurimonas sp. C5]MDH4944225.1 ion transporter [Sulfurimonas sp. C5]